MDEFKKRRNKDIVLSVYKAFADSAKLFGLSWYNEHVSKLDEALKTGDYKTAREIAKIPSLVMINMIRELRDDAKKEAMQNRCGNCKFFGVVTKEMDGYFQYKWPYTKPCQFAIDTRYKSRIKYRGLIERDMACEKFAEKVQNDNIDPV